MYPIPADVVTPCADDPELMFPERRSAFLARFVFAGGVWGGTDDDERKEMRDREGIVAVRPVVNVPRGNQKAIPHGTPVGVEHHRRKYQPLCDTCFGFDLERKGRAS